MTTDLSRRSVAKGAAWAVPAVSVAGAAPALAVSSTVTTASVCQIDEGTGNANGQTTKVYFQLSTNDGTPILKGTTFTYDVTLDSTTYGTASGVPQLSYGSWMTAIVKPGSVSQTGAVTKFTVVITVTTDQPNTLCEAFMQWDNSTSSSNRMGPNTVVTVAPVQSAPAPSNGTTKIGGLTFNTGSRWSTSVNDKSHLKPVNVVTLSGSQTCYPLVVFTYTYTNYHGDAQVCYNGASCVTAVDRGTAPASQAVAGTCS